MAEFEINISVEIRNLLDYDPETGVFRWRERTVAMFDATPRRTAEHRCANWNGRFAGIVAGVIRSGGYLQIFIFGGHHRAHRLAWLYMTGAWPLAEIDHINLDPSDNRWENLREATHSQNGTNKRRHRDNTSGFKGVNWHKASQKWRARIMKEKCEMSLGYFDTAEAAYAAYCEAANRLHGEFARVA